MSWFVCPEGYREFPDIQNYVEFLTRIKENIFDHVDWVLVNQWNCTGEIIDYLGPRLASGEIRAVGIDPITGNLIKIPSNAWRKRYWNQSKYMSAIGMVFERRSIDIPRADGSVVSVRALMSEREITKAFSDDDPPPVPHARASDLPEYASKKEATEQLFEAPLSARERGGRPRADYWDDFWTEVVLFADINNLPTDKLELQKHMGQWAANRAAEGRSNPDEKTIRLRLTDLYQERLRRNRSNLG